MKYALLVLLAASSAYAQDAMSKDNHHWMKYKAGTSVTFTIKMSAGGQEMEGKMKQTLADVKDNSYTTKNSFEMAGQTNDDEETEDLPTKDGEETLKIGDKEYKCTIWKAKSKQGEKESSSRVWLTEGIKVPLKIETKKDNDTTVATAVEVSEKIKAGGKEYDCVRLEGDMATEMGKAKAKFWMNGDVPGMAIKILMDMKGDMGEAQMTFELSEIDIK